MAGSASVDAGFVMPVILDGCKHIGVAAEGFALDKRIFELDDDSGESSGVVLQGLAEAECHVE